MNALTLENIFFSYSVGTPMQVDALKDISFCIEKGKTVGIIGHTGSGKSTLVRLFNGLERPTSGRVLLNEKDIWENPKKIKDVRFKVGLVMQYPEYQLFDETVYEDIAFGLKNMGLQKDEIARRVKKYSEIVGLSDEELSKSPFDLSGGQKRRAAIAGIMVMEPEVIVLDEPAAGLDPEGRKNIFDAIDRFKQESNATVIIVSHSMEDMAERCDLIAILKKGRLETFGSADEIFSNPSVLTEAGLDVPEITAMSELLAQKGIDIGNVYTVEQALNALASVLGKGDKA